MSDKEIAFNTTEWSLASNILPEWDAVSHGAQKEDRAEWHTWILDKVDSTI